MMIKDYKQGMWKWNAFKECESEMLEIKST